MTKLAKSNQPYERRQIVSYMGKVGHFRMDGRRFIIWKHMTFYCGKGVAPIAAEFVRMANRDDEGYLRIEDLKPGEIAVTPGLIYRKIPMSGLIMAEHMRKMKTFKPRDLVVYEKDTSAPAEDLGTIDLTGATKQ